MENDEREGFVSIIQDLKEEISTKDKQIQDLMEQLGEAIDTLKEIKNMAS